MSKQKKNTQPKDIEADTRNQPNEPVPTRGIYNATLVISLVGLIAQLVIAAIVYPHLSGGIESGWFGWAQPGGILPSWLIFVAFPGAQIAVLLLTIFSGKDAEGKRVMESGKATSLVLLTVLFTALQASAFRLV